MPYMFVCGVYNVPKYVALGSLLEDQLRQAKSMDISRNEDVKAKLVERPTIRGFIC